MTIQTPKLQAGEIAFLAEGPQPLLREVPSGEPYPVAALGPLCAAVEAVQAAVQAPVALAAGSALASALLAVQGHADVETLGGPRPLSLFLLTIAQSGERKSACYEPFLAVVRRKEKEDAHAHQEALDAWQDDLDLWKGERERILGEAKKTKGGGKSVARSQLEALGK